jgi:hypothetical protein
MQKYKDVDGDIIWKGISRLIDFGVC